jgi:hypothetical protein
MKLLMTGSACLEEDTPATVEEVPRKMRDTAGGTPALPFEEAATFSPQQPITRAF